MYLKGIEIKGFKSFLDKTSITFPKGMISIVGPNGSGKSNILDAIRWVLGEQSIKSLRGDKLEDVIFSGTQTRNALGYCEVTLILDNEDKKVDIDYTELSIKRKAYRSGESQFFINGKKCRLKDIKEILLDTGIGKEGYSIISQGRVDEIINSTGNQKRALLEEASGITKYRYKKEEGEKNLASATENLERINDIFIEIENQIKPLKLQKEKAEKYLQYSKELKVQEINKILKNEQELKKDIEKIQIQSSQIKDELSKNELELKNTSDILSSTQDELDYITRKKEELNAEISENKSNLAKNSSEISIKNENIKNMLDTNELLKCQIDDADEELENIKQKYEHLKNEFDNTTCQKSDIANSITAHLEDKKSINAQINELSLNIRNYEQKTRDTENEIAKIETKIEFQKTNINSFAQKFLEYEQEFKNYNDIIKNLNSKLQEKNQKINEINETLKSIEDEISKNEETLQKYQRENNLLLNKINENNLHIKDLTAKTNLLENLENDMQGFSKGVKFLLRNKNLTGIQNVVANVITVKKGYEKAIEQLLAGRLENIIIDKAHQSKDAIDYLKRENLGRATFLPLDTIKPSQFSYNDEGVKAIDVVEYDNKFANIISNLLARMVIVDDMDTGLKISKKYSNSFKIATKTGEIFNIGGSITGGSSNFSKEIFTRRNTINQNKEDITKLNQAVQNLKAEFENNKNSVDVLNQENEKNKYSLSSNKDVYISLQNETATLKTKLEHQQQMLENLNEERKTVEYTNKKATESYENDIQTLENLNQTQNEMNSKLSSQNEKLRQENEKLDKLQNSINELELKKSLIEQSLSNTKLQIDELSETIKSHSKKTEQSKNKITSNLSQIEKYKELINSIENANVNIQNKISENIEKLSKISSGEKEKSENLKKLREKKEQLLSSQNNINAQIIKIESEESKVNYKIQLLSESLEQSYSMSLQDAKAYEDKTIIISQNTIKTLKEQISALGNVNIDSIEEFAKVNERYIFYKSQKEDLEQSISKINSVIKSLEKSMIEDFKTNFEIINKNFDDIFKILFGGGSGKLILENEDDILNTNIDISVQPPGKKLRGISMLSGGEKALSAIALLFAIIARKPVPFCILDEIDAPLDDANIYRYISYLLTLIDTTQFVTITHRRGTMEASDYIYGVTMQEKGISDIVSLKLEDAKHYIEE
ncbi:chromosome segregation protein SMC [Peptoanaerobacter stomatis]|uniref:Chromosome partition protein Smc n=1 Tax=Peptoanaerobacter stomatis TaxID=796937 RepID=G9XB38_9FIRM|nr:chromosome segregation protein SMC [Peptoanaerobacter stomatis]EHL19872.1 chromosome segregation protein SMC [Peptoanaerobacter stomatis]